jgi:hypothetical protein
MIGRKNQVHVRQHSLSALFVALSQCYPPSSSNSAEEPGAVKREDKVQMPVLVWVFVFGFITGESRTLVGV